MGRTAAETTLTIGPRNSVPSIGTVRGPRLSGRPGSVGGFTLMELVLVLVVISVVLALSAPSLRGFFASRQTADAAATMLSLTKWARSQAVARGCPYRLNIDAPSGPFWLTVQEAGSFVDLNSEMGRRFQLPEGAAVRVLSDLPDPAASYLQFYPSGRNDAATIEITGRQGEVFLVTSPSATEPFRVVSPSEAP